METIRIIWYSLLTIAGLHLAYGLYKGTFCFNTEKDNTDRILLGIIFGATGVEAFCNLLKLFI